MPITITPDGQGTTQFGVGSVLMIGDRGGRAPINDLENLNADFYPFKYSFQTAELSGNAPGIEIPVISDSPDEFPFQRGPLDIINGFTLPAYTTSMEPFFRNIMNDERALVETTDTPPTRATAESGGRIAAVDANAFGSGIAIATGTGTTTGITQPTTGETVRLAITPTGAVTGDPTLTITGTDFNDSRITERVTLSGASTVVSNLWFKTISRVVSSATSTETLTIGGSAEASNRIYQSVFRENAGSELLYGNDIFLLKGTVPNTYREVWINSFSASIAREGGVAYTFTAVGKRPFANEDPDGNTDGTTARTTLEAIDSVRREAFVGWQGGLFYRPPGASADARLSMIDTTLTITNNVAFVPTVSGRRTPGSAYRLRRNVSLTGTLEYKSEETELIEDVLGGEFLEGTYLEFANATRGGVPRKTQFRFGRLQFENVPEAPVSDEGFISRPFTLRAVPSATAPALYIVTEGLEGFSGGLNAISL